MMTEVRLSDVELDPVTQNEVRTVFMPMDDYNQEMKVFGQQYPDPEYEFNCFYDVMFSIFVTYHGVSGILLFMNR